MEGLTTWRIVLSALLEDECEAERAIEIARGLREECPPGIQLDVVFLSHGSSFDRKIEYDGFRIHHVTPPLPETEIYQTLNPTAENLVGNEALAIELARGEVEALRELQPDAYIHGLWPVAGVAAKIAHVSAEIAYLPIPFAPEPYSNYLMDEVSGPMQPKLSLSAEVRKFIFSRIPRKTKLKEPMLSQDNILNAYRKITGKQDTPEIQNLFDMLKADLTVVSNFSSFYEENPMPSGFMVTGPLFPSGEQFDEIDVKILQRFDPDNGTLKIFCPFSSSAGRAALLETVRALSQEAGEWDSVVLCPRSVCYLEEAREAAGENPHIYITDALVPQLRVSSMADVCILNCEPETVQRAIASGTPIVGYGDRIDRQIYLDNLVKQGSAVRVPVQDWQTEQIQAAVAAVGNDPSYREHISKLQELQQRENGRRKAAAAIWNYLHPIPYTYQPSENENP